jgi:polar amino acid transport system substrate-binding protein
MRVQYFLAAVAWGLICGSGVSGASAEVKAPERIVKAGKIVFCTELANPPWEMIDPATQQPADFDIDLAASVSKAMGVTNEHKNIAFDGLIPALQAGRVSRSSPVFTTSQSEERLSIS